MGGITLKSRTVTAVVNCVIVLLVLILYNSDINHKYCKLSSVSPILLNNSIGKNFILCVAKKLLFKFNAIIFNGSSIIR